MKCNKRQITLASSIVIISVFVLSCSNETFKNSEPLTESKIDTTTISQPHYGKWGLDLDAMDRSIKPGDDFYSYMNGTWNKSVEIPDDKLAVGPMISMQDLAQDELKSMINEISLEGTTQGSDTQKIRDWYLSMMDLVKLDSLGLSPLVKDLEAIEKLSSRGDLVDMLAKNLADLGAAPMHLDFGFDAKNAGKTLLEISTTGMALPAREMYLDENYTPIRKSYREHLIRVFTLIGNSNPDISADNVVELETSMAQFTWSKAELRNPIKKFNPVPIEQMDEIAPGIDWTRFMSAAGADAQKIVNATTKSSIASLANLIATAPISKWRDYLRYHLIREAQAALSRSFRDEFFDFYGRSLSGQKEELPRWKTAIESMGGRGYPLVDALGKEYVARYVPHDSRPILRNIVNNILGAFDKRLQQLEWMTPETRNEAREKLAKTTIKVIYPDAWMSTEGLDVVRGDALGNMRRGKAFLFKRTLDWAQNSPDKRFFFNSVYAVNAYANPNWNEIAFLAAIVRPPFFDPTADPAVNYGAMGAVIGHEISHLFDDQGRLYDGDGILRDWWKPQDAQQFIKVTKQLATQMESYEPLPNKHMNGQLVLGESLADLAGLTVAYDAYKISLNGKTAPVLDGFSGDQRFFLGYAQAWRFKGREALIDRLLKIDPHPIANIRPLAVRNLDAWYSAFNIQSDDKLYLARENRVNPW